MQKVKKINKERKKAAPEHKFIGQSFHAEKLKNPSVALAYITAPPRMALYMKYSTRIYDILRRKICMYILSMRFLLIFQDI